jgi:hypothetical protein
MEVKGKITKVCEVIKGTSAAGKEWAKQTFIIDTSETYNNIYPIEIFGEEKIETFAQSNKVGDEVKVLFNVSANEWKDKWFVSLSFWKCETVGAKQENNSTTEGDDDLPF